MRRKRLIALNIAFLIAFLISPYVHLVLSATANAYAYHPECKLYGQVTKDWYVGRKWTEYEDDEGLSSFLPFTRQDENITISFANIVFEKNFENKSIASASETKDSKLTVTKDVLGSPEYIYLKITNNTALSTSTWYSATEKLNISDEPTITNDYYLLVTIKVSKTGGNLTRWRGIVKFHFTDAGATERILQLIVEGSSGTDNIVLASSTYPTYYDYGNDAIYKTIQIQIQDLLDGSGVSWNLVKLKAISYQVSMETGTQLDPTSTVEAWFRHALVLPSKVYIDDPFYENGLIVNGTGGSFTPDAGDIIQIYGANATKIVDVTIPFVMEDSRDFEEICTTIPESYGFLYTWKFILPKSPTTGDSLTYSNTNITLKSWFDGAFIDSFYVNGVDKTTQVSSKKVDTSTGLQDSERAWTYLVASSLTAGNQYDIELKVTDLPKDVWMSLTSEPVGILSWQYWYDKLLAIIAFVANALGLTGTYQWAESERRKLRVPKR